jgi:hypothetical protein
MGQVSLLHARGGADTRRRDGVDRAHAAVRPRGRSCSRSFCEADDLSVFLISPGKSSILHAIQLVFGAKAADTSRGRNIAKLIKDGAETAEIHVWIKNSSGPTGYKHERYGDEIDVMRRFKRNGKDGATSTYLMSGVGSDGKRNSTRASIDVKEMCEVRATLPSREWLARLWCGAGAHATSSFLVSM